MAYTPVTWIDRITDQDGKVVVRGTPLNALNFNHIETGIAEAHASIQEVRTTTVTTTALQTVINQISTLQTQLNSAAEAIESLEGEMEDAQTDLGQHALSLSDLQTTTNTHTTEISGIKGGAASTVTLKSLKTQLDTLNTSLTNLTTKVTTLETWKTNVLDGSTVVVIKTA